MALNNKDDMADIKTKEQKNPTSGKNKEIFIDVQRLFEFLNKEVKNDKNSFEERSQCAYYIGYIHGMREQYHEGQEKTAQMIKKADEFMKELSFRNLPVSKTSN